MTAATYTFTRSGDLSAAASMVVELRPLTGSSIPGTASRWQGGTTPQLTLNWAAGAGVATGTVNTAGNTAVDGNAEYGWVKVSSTPTGLTLDTSQLPKVTIVDDDTAGSGGKTFGPIDGNSPPAFDTENTGNYVQHVFQTGAMTASMYVGGRSSAIGRSSGDSIMFDVTGDTTSIVYQVRGGTRTQIGTPINMNPANGQLLWIRQNKDMSVDVLLDTTVIRSFSADQCWPAAAGLTPGTYGRFITEFINNGFITKQVKIGPVA